MGSSDAMIVWLASTQANIRKQYMIAEKRVHVWVYVCGYNTCVNNKLKRGEKRVTVM